MRLAGLVLAAALGAVPTVGQLHLITGYSTEGRSDGHAASVFLVEADGTLSPVVELAPGGWNKGTIWIGVSDELRRAVVLASGPTQTELSLLVLDLDTWTVMKTCQKREHQIGGIQRWLFNLPGKEPAYVERSLSGLTPEGTFGPPDLKGIALDADAPCDEFPVRFSGSDFPNMVVPGVVSDGQSDGLYATADPDGSLRVVSPSHVRLGLQVPSAMLREAAPEPGHWGSLRVVVNNSGILALHTMLAFDPVATGSELLLVYRRGDATWHRVPQVSQLMWCTRGFGGYLVISEAQFKDDKLKESVGAEEWGPELKSGLAQLRFAFTGRLHIYDTETEKAYCIETKQADSEVLFIDHRAVYYRVGDRLYSAPIAKTGLGEPKLLARGRAVREAHWAFITR